MRLARTGVRRGRSTSSLGQQSIGEQFHGIKYYLCIVGFFIFCRCMGRLLQRSQDEVLIRQECLWQRDMTDIHRDWSARRRFSARTGTSPVSFETTGCRGGSDSCFLSHQQVRWELISGPAVPPSVSHRGSLPLLMAATIPIGTMGSGGSQRLIVLLSQGHLSRCCCYFLWRKNVRRDHTTFVRSDRHGTRTKIHLLQFSTCNRLKR